MPTTEPRRGVDEVCRLGDVIFDRSIKSALTPDDDEKFVAIDVNTGEYEVDEDEYSAVMRLHSRIPGAEVYSRRGGSPISHRI